MVMQEEWRRKKEREKVEREIRDRKRKKLDQDLRKQSMHETGSASTGSNWRWKRGERRTEFKNETVTEQPGGEKSLV